MHLFYSVHESNGHLANRISNGAFGLSHTTAGKGVLNVIDGVLPKWYLVFLGLSINDVTLEGEGEVQNSVTICDVGVHGWRLSVVTSRKASGWYVSILEWPRGSRLLV